MTDEEILKAAIKKAQKSGFTKGIDSSDAEDILSGYRPEGLGDIIFSHDFAKAFWGEEREFEKKECSCGVLLGEEHKKDCDIFICGHCKMSTRIRNPSGFCDHLFDACEVCDLDSMDWEEHLQKMVLEKEPLKYIEQFLK